MSAQAASKTVDVLRHVFSSYGLPEQFVSDNFIAEEFVKFMKDNGVKHTRSAPYHLASNGLVERFVQSLKTVLKASRAALATDWLVSCSHIERLRMLPPESLRLHCL